MNPFSQFLSKTITNSNFRVFVNKWDGLEQIVVNTFRKQGDLIADAKVWRRLRAELRKEYPKWRERLEPFWMKATVDGAPAREDPFIWLLSYEDINEFRQNWLAMQTLPAAREAINRLLIELQKDKR
jgi:hypothetical protein